MTGVKLSLMTFIQRNFRNETIPISCAVEKPKYIESRKEVIRKMDKEIKAAQDKMLEIGNPNDQAYQDAAKRLKKCQEIKKNCEDSIELITEQMAIEKKSRIHTR